MYRVATGAGTASDNFLGVGAMISARCVGSLVQSDIGTISSLHADEAQLNVWAAALNPDETDAGGSALVGGDGSHLQVGADLVIHTDVHDGPAASRVKMSD